MHLFSAVIPPSDVVEELAEVVRSAGSGSKPSRSRWGRAKRTAEEPSEGFDLTVTSQMYLPITNFGNVAAGDSVRLADALRQEALTWPTATVHFAGGAALEWPGDESVWAKLEGDVDALMKIGRGVPQVVQRLGFFVDRRQFRPWLSVGTITPETTAPYLEDLVGRLEGFSGQEWTADKVTLLRLMPTDNGTMVNEELERMPVGAPR